MVMIEYDGLFSVNYFLSVLNVFRVFEYLVRDNVLCINSN